MMCQTLSMCAEHSGPPICRGPEDGKVHVHNADDLAQLRNQIAAIRRAFCRPSCTTIELPVVIDTQQHTESAADE
jgi:hypothetical protein